MAVDALSDEFNGTSLDKSKWSPSLFYWKGRPPSVFDPANVSVSGGNLNLKATAAISGNPILWGASWVRTSVVMSRMPLAGPGYYEARLKASDLSVSSSFWLQSQHEAEIDITEAFGASKTRPERTNMMAAATHEFRRGWKTDQPTIHHFTTSTPVTEWHTYGAWWKDARTIWFYLDNQKVGESNASYDRFNQPMYLFLDTETFPQFGLPDLASLADPERNTMRVDWVRSWALAPD
ncbi:family 16 glycosylhydrolase [Caulobacter sp. LARHSG274]